MTGKKKKEKVIKTNARVLMIQFPHATKTVTLFTDLKNYPYLIEWSKEITAKLSIVRVEKAELKELYEIANENNYNYNNDVKFTEIKDITVRKLPDPIPEKSVPKIDFKKTKEILQKFILSKNLISTADILNINELQSLSKSTIRRRYLSVLSDLNNEGYTTTKVGYGKYKISKVD